LFVFRKPVLDKALRRRVAVNFLDGAASFTGRLAEYDNNTYVLEACETIPTPAEVQQGVKAQPILGRQYIDRVHAFLQELPT
jgi:small nuclear ribonucleoprotein (snRNP)-like protein